MHIWQLQEAKAQHEPQMIDSLMAASALVHNYKLVTRNAKDFKDITGLEVINPWEI
jgi:predicted nucleic acid-binding protein